MNAVNKRETGSNRELPYLYSSLLPPKTPSLNPSSASTNEANFAFDGGISSPSSPKRKAAFSRLDPAVGLRPDFRRGDDAFGGDDFPNAVGGVLSGSSIQEKDDCAILDRVGTGAVGRVRNFRSSFRASDLTSAGVKTVNGPVAGDLSILCFSIFVAGSRIGADGSSRSDASTGVFFAMTFAGCGYRDGDGDGSFGEELGGGRGVVVPTDAFTGVDVRGGAPSGGSDCRGIVESFK